LKCLGRHTSNKIQNDTSVNRGGIVTEAKSHLL